MILVEADVSEEWDSSTGWAELAEGAARAAVSASDYKPLIDTPLAIEISVRFANDEEVRGLNASYRGKDKRTNVLSFPMIEPEMLGRLGRGQPGEMLLGDIVLARGVCVREAAEKGVSVADHASHLVVHGTLHLLGYDHEEGEAQADAMEAVERRALSTIGIADPYAAEAGAER